MSEYKYSGIEGHEEDMRHATMQKNSCAITKDILKYLNNLSIQYGYNRQLIDSIFESRDTVDDDSLTDVIDERFPCFMTMAMPHYHKEGKKTDMHYRTAWACIFVGNQTKPVTLMVDIPATAFELLPDVPQIKYLEADEWKAWWEQEKEQMTKDFIDSVESWSNEKGR